MTIRRFLSVVGNKHRRWKALFFPFAVIGHRFFGWSYASVNISRGAWMLPSEGFGALWHWRHYAEPLAEMPGQTIFRGCAYRVARHEGMIVFSEIGGAWGCNRRISISRVGRSLPLVELDGPTPAGHVSDAIEFAAGVEVKSQS
jgi:hypothetical protein